jgi:hypothetical protein
MSPEAQSILRHLRTVEAERARRSSNAGLSARVEAVKRYQHARFAKTYSDLLAQPRYARAARFFLEELYGPHDFTERDAQFARIVPGLVRLFPHDIVTTVRALAELHAISERLDSVLAGALPDEELGAPGYVRAWQATGEPVLRQRQIDLMLEIGRALDRYTRNPLLRHSLRMMRGPAHAAGLGALQTFLESGFDTFRGMRGAAEFLHTVATRERALCEALFAASPDALRNAAGGAACAADAALLGQLP